MKHRDYILAEIRDEDGNQDNLDKGDVCELAFTLAAERDEARKLAEGYRDKYWSANSHAWSMGKRIPESELPWEAKKQ